ncbi:MAG: hypothetical protein JW940_27645 [Polyangiaceae bacterium]|nr:hypothetical protein [Polyangiaceae bacterium]
MIRKAKWLATLALGGFIACSGGKGSPGDPPTEPGPSPIADNLPAADLERPPADDQAPSVDDQAPPVDDQAPPADDQTAPVDDQPVPVDEQGSSRPNEPDGQEGNCTPQGGCVCSNDCEWCICELQRGNASEEMCAAACGQ